LYLAWPEQRLPDHLTLALAFSSSILPPHVQPILLLGVTVLVLLSLFHTNTVLREGGPRARRRAALAWDHFAASHGCSLESEPSISQSLNAYNECGALVMDFSSPITTLDRWLDSRSSTSCSCSAWRSTVYSHLFKKKSEMVRPPPTQQRNCYRGSRGIRGEAGEVDAVCRTHGKGGQDGQHVKWANTFAIPVACIRDPSEPEEARECSHREACRHASNQRWSPPVPSREVNAGSFGTSSDRTRGPQRKLADSHVS
jgi:hypothetical protein